MALGRRGSVSVFPPPHQFFFAREVETNRRLCLVPERRRGFLFAGVRQAAHEEAYNPEWNRQVYALYNAPPGTWQRMSAYLYFSRRRELVQSSAEATEKLRSPSLTATASRNCPLQDPGHPLPHRVYEELTASEASTP